MAGPIETEREPLVNTGRLWAGGVATAVVAALIERTVVVLGHERDGGAAGSAGSV